MQDINNAKKKHYYVICGQVMWRAEAEAETMRVIPANTIAAFDDPFIRQFDLARINMALVENAGQMVGEVINPALVAGVVLMSLNPIGYMTEETFRKTPSTHAVASEVEKEVAAAETAAEDQAERT